MARTQYCVPCGYDRNPQVATHLVDDEPMCLMHASMQPADLERKPIDAPVPLCPRGCGKPPHRGRCAKGLADGGKRFVVEGHRTTPEDVGQIESANKQAAQQIVAVVTKKKAAVELPSLMEPTSEPISSRPRRNKGTPVKLDTLKSQTIDINDIPDEAIERPTKHGRIGTLWLKLLELPPGKVEAVENRDLQNMSSTITHIVNKGKKHNRVVQHRIHGLTVYFWLEPKT